MPYPANLIARMLYGCGLRVSEPLNLRIKDIDLERRRLCIRGAKGGNDRVVSLPLSLVAELTQRIKLARTVWERDKHNGTADYAAPPIGSEIPSIRVQLGLGMALPRPQHVP